MRVFAIVFSGCLSRQMLFQDSPEGLGNPRRGFRLGPERHRRAQTAQESLRAAQRDSKRSEETQRSSERPTEQALRGTEPKRGPEKPGEAHRTGPERHRAARQVRPERDRDIQGVPKTPRQGKKRANQPQTVKEKLGSQRGQRSSKSQRGSGRPGDV